MLSNLIDSISSSQPVSIPSAETRLFDLAGEYDEMLNRGIRLSGENKAFFIAGRVGDLARQLPSNFNPDRILDFGCGIGDTSSFLARTFGNAEVVGVDVADNVLAYASETNGSSRVSFHPPRESFKPGTFDLCYTNGVFHHIHPSERRGTLDEINQAMAPGGYLALFENNPWNIGTHMVMSRIPFDRDARLLSVAETRRLVRQSGFRVLLTRSLFYFPRLLAFLRPAESSLARLPLGAQYYVLARKQE